MHEASTPTPKHLSPITRRSKQPRKLLQIHLVDLVETTSHSTVYIDDRDNLTLAR